MRYAIYCHDKFSLIKYLIEAQKTVFVQDENGTSMSINHQLRRVFIQNCIKIPYRMLSSAFNFLCSIFSISSNSAPTRLFPTQESFLGFSSPISTFGYAVAVGKLSPSSPWPAILATRAHLLSNIGLLHKATVHPHRVSECFD